MLCACTPSSPELDEDGGFPSSARSDEDAAREDVAGDLDGESFESIGDVSTCTEDCSGHDAGFEWARDHDVTDASECGGGSLSFEEGCRTYADAIQERMDDARSDALDEALSEADPYVS